ncbi:uncharacterized protein LOC114788715 isoform X2 [Denticeps clupeoides]|nr:uncharacterized protein LOC114788715 isoform X2 [Denticeps clupeoides]XP_028833389.1 uncharacterized protein LOC114788715 isoform X2 [Denticeps clupeoides]
MKSLWCLLLSLSLVIAADIQTLGSIKDLEGKAFGQHFPHHGLMLLHWFASLIDIDENNIIRFKKQSFDPVTNFPFHPYENDAKSLPKIIQTRKRAYFSVGNLKNGLVGQLPSYVTQEFYNSQSYEDRNRDRIVVVIDAWYAPVRIDQVYITQDSINSHPNGTEGDSHPTYQASPQLLRQIATLRNPLDCRNTFLKEIFPHLDFSLTIAENMFSEPGLALFLALAGYNLQGRYNISMETWYCPTSQSLQERKALCDTSRQDLEVKTSQQGKALISWRGLPSSILKTHTTVALFQREGCNGPLTEVRIDGEVAGTRETTVPFNPGLQVRLIKQDLGDTVIWWGPEVDDADGRVPVQIKDKDASLQLFARDGYAHARVYIKKTFTQWKEEFFNAWVGFYSSAADCNENYLSGQWQWVTKFSKVSPDLFSKFYIYEYASGTSIAPGVQLRFFLRDYDEGARTLPWE